MGLTRIIRQRIFLIAISTILGVFAAELILEFLPPLEFLRTIREQNIPGPDYRVRNEIISDLQKAGSPAIPSFSPMVFIEYEDAGAGRIFPLSGISYQSTFLCNEYGVTIFYDSDEHGFNNPRGLYDKPPVDTILLGDSFVHGNCVPPGEDVAGQLRTHGIDAINLGFLGIGPLTELAVLREYGRVLQPRTVIWFYYEGNDQVNLQAEKNDDTLFRYLADKDFSQDLFNRQDEIDIAVRDYYLSFIDTIADRKPAREAFLRVITLGNLRAEISRLFVSDKKIFQQNTRYDLDLLARILQAAQEETHSWGGELYFVYLPTRVRFEKECRSCGDLFRKTAILSIVEKLGIESIDMVPVFEVQPDPVYLIPGHYNSQGYALVTETILKSLGR